MDLQGFIECPGLEFFHSGFQYFASSVCQICVVKFKQYKNASFNIHFFTLLFVFRLKIYFAMEYLTRNSVLINEQLIQFFNLVRFDYSIIRLEVIGIKCDKPGQLWTVKTAFGLRFDKNAIG